jgi:hypothetical protein
MSFLQKIYARYSVVSDISDISKSPNMQILPKKIGTTYSPAQVVKYIKSVDPLENKMGRDTSFRSVVAKHKIFTTKKVAIADIEIPTKYPHRVNREFAEHYAKLDPKTVPMVVLEFHKPLEKYIILDGRHRIWAAKLRKEKYIFALVGDGQLSYLKAVQANSEEQSPLNGKKVIAGLSLICH